MKRGIAVKITNFSPIIVTENAGAVTELFEALGFAHRHTKAGVGGGRVTVSDMKDANGFRVDIAQGDGLLRDQVLIRMNVDDIAAAMKLLAAHGFRNIHGDEIEDSGSSKTALMISPTGFAIRVIQHTKP